MILLLTVLRLLEVSHLGLNSLVPSLEFYKKYTNFFDLIWL